MNKKMQDISLENAINHYQELTKWEQILVPSCRSKSCFLLTQDDVENFMIQNPSGIKKGYVLVDVWIFKDIIDNATSQLLSDDSIEKKIEALHYYINNDAFIDFRRE